MAAHRHWRLVGFAVNGGGPLELSEARLYSAGVLADQAATLACTFAPSSGALADLRDDLATGVVSWPRAAHASPGFALVWDFGSAADVGAIKLGSGNDAGTFPLDLVLQWSDDAAAWTTQVNAVSIQYPGPLALTAQAGSSDAQTWDSSANAAGIVLSGSNLTATRSASGGGWSTARALVAITGKKYWEITLAEAGGDGTPYLLSGVVNLSALLTTYIGSAAGGWGYHGVSGNLYLAGNNIPPNLPTCTVGDVIMYALDATSGKLWFGKNGQWFLGGNPGAGTGEQAVTTGDVYPAASLYYASTQITARFSSFSYSPPEGFGGLTAPFIPLQQAPGNRFTQKAQAGDQIIGSPLPLGVATCVKPEYSFMDAYHGGKGIIRSTVKQKDTPVNTPLRRRVDLIDERSRLVIRSTWSDAATGDYEFRGIREDLVYSVAAWDHLHNYRAEIADNLTLANGVELL